MSEVARLVGLGIAGAGVAHFAKPEIFEPIAVTAFPTNTREHIYAAGAFDIVLGLGLVAPSTRKLAVAGLVGYAAISAQTRSPTGLIQHSPPPVAEADNASGVSNLNIRGVSFPVSNRWVDGASRIRLGAPAWRVRLVHLESSWG
jgi:hypothetical protein